MTSFKTLQRLAKKLRSPTGCPWDRSRTIEDMAESMEEEAEEIQEAFKKKDWANLREELGDVKDVLKDIDEKIRSRHTWVFGKDKANTPEEALEMWNRNKQAQKAEGDSVPSQAEG